MVAEKPEPKTEEKTEEKTEGEVKTEPASPKPKPKPLSKKSPAPKKAAATPKKVVESPKEEDTPKNEDAPKENDDFKKPLPPTPKKEGEEKSEASEGSDENAKPSEDATLILSAEEEAEISAQTNEDAVKDSKEATSKSAKKKKPASKNVWVSNIARSTKAADLKKLFSDKFKVDSAKIVTNGKSFFGYICLESAEMAEQSVKELNGTELDERKLTISLTRPDLRSSTRSSAESRRKELRSRITNGVKKDDDKKKEEKGEDKKEKDKEKDKEGTEGADKDAKDQSGSEEKKEKETPEEKLKRLERRDQRSQRQIQDLRADVKRLTIELQNNRRRLTEANRRLDMERDRKLEMRRDITALEAQLKSERRKFDQELEQLEKRMKVDELRYQEDRAILNKELDECRKLREYLQRKVDDLSGPRHGRSPPRRSGPGGGRGMIERDSEKMQRPRIDGRGRSPPPPPKINARRSRERSPGGYKGKKPRIDDGPRGYSNSHYPGGPQPSFQGGSKPLLGSYPPQGPGGPRPMSYGTAYPEPSRYGSYPTSFSMGNPAPLMGRPMGYPDPRSSSNQRKY